MSADSVLDNLLTRQFDNVSKRLSGHQIHGHLPKLGTRLVLAGIGIGVTLIISVPLLLLVLEGAMAGPANIGSLIWRPLTGMLIWNTVRVTAVASAACAVVGTLSAWCVERTNVPFRRLWSVLLVLPFAVPDFVMSFGWSSVSDLVSGYWGALLIMTLGLYPLVYLTVAASLRSADSGLEEAARALGAGRIETFVRVTLRQCRAAILGGTALVALILLAEYGAFENLGYQTLTTEINTQLSVSFNVSAACVLSLLLVGIGIVILGGGAAASGQARTLTHAGPLVPHPVHRHKVGPMRWVIAAGLAALVGLALGVPVGSVIYWMFEGGYQSPGGASVVDAGWHTLLYAGAAAAVATVLAVPVAFIAVRSRARLPRVMARATYLVLSMPSRVVAVAFAYFSFTYLDGLGYQSTQLLILIYAILFFPLALVAVAASMTYVPAALEEAARSLGTPSFRSFGRITLPLLAPGMAAGFALVFIGCTTEVSATLMLAPTGVQTLATQFWAYQHNLSYGQAAPFALTMIALAAVPGFVLARYFNRLPSRATGSR